MLVSLDMSSFYFDYLVCRNLTDLGTHDILTLLGI